MHANDRSLARFPFGQGSEPRLRVARRRSGRVLSSPRQSDGPERRSQWLSTEPLGRRPIDGHSRSDASRLKTKSNRRTF